MLWQRPIFWNPSKPFVDRCLCAPALAVLYLYKRLLSPLLGSGCRFYPTCSDYAREAFWRKGFWTACWLTAWRLVRCNPFHPGGYDPLEPDDTPPDGSPPERRPPERERPRSH